MAADGVDVLLADGSTVHVRPIRPDDAERVVALHSRFSARTRYLRYFSPYPRIPPRDLERFVNVDHHDREALVAASGADLIAIGRYERLGPDAPDAEVAFVVEDGYQGLGVGSMLLEHLADAARTAGLERFVAEVLPENGPMLRVFSDAGFGVRREFADGVVHLTFPIAPTSRSVSVQQHREQRTEAASIARLLAPRSVVVYGARRDGHGVGATLLRHLREGGYTGPVHPVHPTASTVDGLAALASAVDAPGPVDLALVAVPADQVAAVVADAGRARVHALAVVSTGFADSGPGAAAGPGLTAQRDLVAAARAQGMRVVGPNCLGIVNTDPGVRLNASLAPQLPERGRIGVFCQSAAVGIAVLAEAKRRQLGLSTFVSVGNRADVSGNDLLQFWRDDARTDLVLLYLETFGNPRKFARIARELSRDKPIVAVAAGQASPARAGSGSAAAGSAAAGSGLAAPRSGQALIGSGPAAVPLPASTLSGLDPEAAAALFAHSGVVRVPTVAEMFDVGEVFATQPLPAGRRVGVVANAAALVTLATGACAAAGLTAVTGAWGGAPLTQESTSDELCAVVTQALSDSTVDSVVVVLAPPVPDAGLGMDPAAGAHVDTVARALAGGDKPVVLTLVGSAAASAAVPIFPTVEEAVRALSHVTAYAMWRAEPSGTTPELSHVDNAAGRRRAARGARVEELLAAYGIDVVATRAADTPRGVLAAAKAIGYPVALKAAAENLRHRLDLGAVRLDLADPKALRSAFAEVSARFGTAVLVQPMVAPGVACVAEVVEDPAFGPVVGFGLGGVASDLLGDRAWRAAPLTDRGAAALVRAPRAAAMLLGYRGAPPVDVDALADLLLRLGELADDNPSVKRLVLNPVMAHASGLSVLHAEVDYGVAAPRPDSGPRHLR